MRLNILIGGKAGQGINVISGIVSKVLVRLGYFTFNYRDYQSLIRGGHNFNVLSVSDEKIGSHESLFDGIIAFDERTIETHKKELKKTGFILDYRKFESFEKNINMALAGALIRILGINRSVLIEEIKKKFNDERAISAVNKGFESEKSRFNLKQQKNKVFIMTGSQGVALGAINSKIERYFGYPMSPSTGLLHELASRQFENNLIVFQPENEIAVINAALGASYSGCSSMVGTAGGGFDLMSEGLSFQGQSEIPLVVYLASRPGPGTGVPTYNSQADLNISLRAGHGEFPRVVIAPGDPIECVEKTNEAFYLSQKFNCLSIILSDKHLAECEFSSERIPNKIIHVKSNRKIPGISNEVVKMSSYEHDEYGNTTESAELSKINAMNRIKKYDKIKKECSKFEMFKIHGKQNSKNLIIGWGSTKTSILDAIKGLDYKFLQVIYMKPLSEKIKKEMEKAKKVILIEQNSTGQLGRLIREKTGIKIKKRILKIDYRPFISDLLKKEILKIK